MAKLALPAGSWFVSAKAPLRDSSATKVIHITAINAGALEITAVD